MLKITDINGENQRTLVLEGKLVDPWLTELVKIWHDVRLQNDGRALTLDLHEVTTISERGQDLLGEMCREGVRFKSCGGVLTRHLVRKLIQRCAAPMKKGCKA